MGYKTTVMARRDNVKKPPFDNDVYVISDSTAALKTAVEQGAAIVQLRDKESGDEAVLRKASELRDFQKVMPFAFIINDDPGVALAAGADGVHVGQDTDTRQVREIVGKGMILGKTTHNLEQAMQAVRDGADYISVGPVYATPTKPGRPAVGLEYVRQAANARLPIPFVVIGGIDMGNIDDVIAAGARTVGIVRAYGQTKQILERIRLQGRMKIVVNGKAMEVDNEKCLNDFLLSLRPNTDGFIVELNEEIIPRDAWSRTIIAEGDRLELVSLVGGG